MLHSIDRMFDFNRDGELDSIERVAQMEFLDDIGRDENGEDGDDIVDDGESDVFAEAGLDPDELEFMDAAERREALEDAGLDPDEFDF